MDRYFGSMRRRLRMVVDDLGLVLRVILLMFEFAAALILEGIAALRKRSR